MIQVIGWFIGWIICALFWGTLAWLANHLFYGDWDWWNTIRWWFLIVFLFYIIKEMCKAPSPRYRGSSNGPFIGL